MDRHALETMIKAVADGNNMSLTSIAQLAEEMARHDETVPTVAAFAPRVEAVEAGASDWHAIAGDIDRLVGQFGDQRLDQVRPADIQAFANRLARGSDEGPVVEDDEQERLEKFPYQLRRDFVEAARRFFRVATNDDLISRNPAERIDLPVPTVAEFYDRVEQVDGDKAGWTSRRGQMQLLKDELGRQRLDKVKSGDIEDIAVAKRKKVVDDEEQRRAKLDERDLSGAPRRHGRGAQRNLLEAARRMFTIAVEDKLIDENPAHKIELPKREEPTARAPTGDRLEGLWKCVVSGGDDTELDSLLVWFILETGARRGGAIGLKIRDIKVRSCVIVLYEKGRHGKKERIQPVSRELIEALLAHATTRGPGRNNDAVFFYKDSTPEEPHALTKKRAETLMNRIRKEWAWASENWMKLHDLRRTGATMIERISGSPAIARKFLGQSTGTPLDTYDAAGDDELRAALSAWLGRPVGAEAVAADAATNSTGRPALTDTLGPPPPNGSLQ